MIKNIIFDLDGTLLDTLPDLTESLNLLFREYHSDYTVSLKMMKNYVGEGAKKMILKALQESDLQLKNDEINQFHLRYLELYHKHLIGKTQLYPNALDVLSHYRQKGYQLFLFSNKPDVLTLKLLDHFHINYFFKKAAGAGSIEHKPHPAFFSIIEKEFHCNNKETMMVGDGIPDIQFAKNSGIISVALLNGYEDRKKINEQHPDYQIETLKDMLNLTN